MNKKTRKALVLLLGAVFLAGVGLMIRQALDYIDNEVTTPPSIFIDFFALGGYYGEGASDNGRCERYLKGPGPFAPRPALTPRR